MPNTLTISGQISHCIKRQNRDKINYDFSEGVFC